MPACKSTISSHHTTLSVLWFASSDKRRNWGSEKLRDPPQVTQLLGNEAKIQVRFCLNSRAFEFCPTTSQWWWRWHRNYFPPWKRQYLRFLDQTARIETLRQITTGSVPGAWNFLCISAELSWTGLNCTAGVQVRVAGDKAQGECCRLPGNHTPQREVTLCFLQASADCLPHIWE